MFRQRTPRPILFSACLAGLVLGACGGSDEGGAKEAPAVVDSSAAKTAAEASAAGSESAEAVADAAPKKKKSPPRLVESPMAGTTTPSKPDGIELPADDPILGPVLVINGEVIPHERVRRQIILGPAGNAALEMARLDLLMQQEIERRVEAGADAAEFSVDPKIVQDEIAAEKANLAKEYPGQDVRLEDLVGHLGGTLEDRVASTKLFMKLFVPEDVPPTEFPMTTIEAFNSNDQGRLILDALQTEYAARVEGKPVDANPMFRQMVFQSLTEYLIATSVIEQGDDLPSGVLMRVNGDDITTDSIWSLIKDNVSSADVRSAKQWILNFELLARDLGERWLDDEEAEAKYQEHSEPYRDTMFSVEKVAMMIKRYPSVDAYKSFRRAYDSYQATIADQLTTETLREFSDKRTKPLIGQSQVDVDIILCSAYDFKRRQWKENGWQEAARNATEVIKALAQGTKTWDQLINEYSGFYDPPLPESYVGEAPEKKSGGRFRAKSRNMLMQALEESEYWQFLNGQTITDFIFFEQEPNTVAQPIRGPYGWYIPRLIRRNNSPTAISASEDQILVMAKQDYTTTKLLEHIQELVEENEVYGLE